MRSSKRRCQAGSSYVRRVARVKTLYLLLFISVACSRMAVTPPEAPKCDVEPQSLMLRLSVGQHVNRDSEGRALPTQVRILQLDQALESERELGSFDSLSELASVVHAHTLTVYPDEAVEVMLQRHEHAEFIAVAADVREPRGRSWFGERELPKLESCGDRALAAKIRLEEVRVNIDTFLASKVGDDGTAK